MIARAGVGIDNIDVAAATKRGIIVANAPRSNIVTAAEHTMALLLALARNIPQAHGSLTAGRWDRTLYNGTELMDKTFGVLGFGRIGQLVAARAKGFGMRVIAYDPYVATERYGNLGVEKRDTSEELVGTKFDEAEVNLGSAAVGHTPDGGDQQHAVMIVTTDVPVSQELVNEITASSDNFVDGRTVALG